MWAARVRAPGKADGSAEPLSATLRGPRPAPEPPQVVMRAGYLMPTAALATLTVVPV